MMGIYVRANELQPHSKAFCLRGEIDIRPSIRTVAIGAANEQATMNKRDQQQAKEDA